MLGCYSGSRFADTGGAVVPAQLSEGSGRMDEGNLSGGEESCGGGAGVSSADKTIHSGHFMVSCLSDDEQEEEEEETAVVVAGVALDTPSCPACPPAVKEEAPEELRGTRSSVAYDFAGASRQTRDTYQFEAPCSNTIDQSLAQMLQHMKLAYRSVMQNFACFLQV